MRSSPFRPFAPSPAAARGPAAFGASAAILLLAAALALPAAWAQSPRTVSLAHARVAAHPLPMDRGAAGLWQTLKKLHTRASLIMIDAHPDDEDGPMMDYMSRGLGARVSLLTLNRGEGGANVMSANYWDQLGLVRTEELLHADRYYGVAQQFFSRMCDFGFSKSKRETLDKWGKQRLLADVVRVIRMDRPLVITSVFVGGHSDGHGNHQAAGEMAQLAFQDAGNPNMFPEQIAQGLLPWTPLKDYARVPFFLGSDASHPNQLYDYANHHWYPLQFYNYISGQWLPGQLSTSVRVPVGQLAPLLGLNYLQIARLGLGFQKSQNGGVGLPEAGAQLNAYHRFGSRVQVPAQESSMFQGIDISLPGIADLAPGPAGAFLRPALERINAKVERAMREFDAAHPAKIAPVLADGYRLTNALVRQVQASGLGREAKYNVLYDLHVKQAQFNTALVEALGLTMQATVAPAHPPTGIFARFMGTPPSFTTAIPGQHFWVNVHLVASGPDPVQLTAVQLAGVGGQNWNAVRHTPLTAALGGNEPLNVRFSATVPENVPFTKPYFSRPDIEQPYYNILQTQYVDRPLAPYPLVAWARLRYHGVPIRMGEVVQSVSRITGPGKVLRPLVTAPAIAVSITPIAGIVPLGAHSFTLTAGIHSNVSGPAQGTVHLDLPAGWRSVPAQADFSAARDGQDQSIQFQVMPANLQAQPYRIEAVAEFNGKSYRQGYTTVGYPGLRPYNDYREAIYRTTGVDVRVAHDLKIGYIMGSGDEVPQSLENLGVHVHFLTAQDIASGNLDQYDEIILGVRTYAVRPELATYNSRLLRYVHQGGVMIVEYNTPEFDHDYGPYPYKMTNDPEEVTNEDSPMVILQPDNPVFTWPNKITLQDFNGWIEERGSKFMHSWSPQYQALLSTHDPGQAPQSGGLLYARYGKGIYIYCAYAFYRELPAGVPGAYRLFANMISLPRNPAVFPAAAAAAGQ